MLALAWYLLFQHLVLLLSGHVLALAWLLYYITSRASFIVMMNTNMSKYIPAGSSPGLTRAPGQPLSGSYIGCSVLHNVPARPTFSVYRCNRRRCATCAVIKPLRFFRSCLTSRRYTVISACDLSCSTTSVIYRISCAKCDQQYVGEKTKSQCTTIWSSLFYQETRKHFHRSAFQLARTYYG